MTDIDTQNLIQQRARWLSRRLRISVTRALALAEIAFTVGAPR